METLILNSAVLPFLRLILIPTQMYKVLCVSNKKKFLVGWVVHTTTQCSGAEPEEVKFQLGHQSHWVIAVFSQTWNFCRFNSELSSAPLMHYSSDLTVRGQKKAELEEEEEEVWNFPCNCSFTPFFTCSILVFNSSVEPWVLESWASSLADSNWILFRRIPVFCVELLLTRSDNKI